jgi:hypothetical protein
MTNNAPDIIGIMLPTEPKPMRLEIERGVPRVVIERALARAGVVLTPLVKATLDHFFATKH